MLIVPKELANLPFGPISPDRVAELACDADAKPCRLAGDITYTQRIHREFPALDRRLPDRGSSPKPTGLGKPIRRRR